MKKSRLAILLVLACAAALLLVMGSPAWRLLTTKRVLLEYKFPKFHPICTSYHTIRGWRIVKRWGDKPTPHGVEVLYYEENGLKAVKMLWKNGYLLKATSWTFNGDVHLLARDGYFGQGNTWSLKAEGPWWWPVEKQTTPTAPWWKDKDSKQ